MVAQPVALYEKPGSPALPREAPSSVSHRAMAMNGNGESGAAAPTAARTGKGNGSAPGANRRVEPYPTAAAGEAETTSPPPGLFVAAFESGSPLLDAERQRRARPEVAPVAMAAMAMTPPTRPSAAVTPPTAMEPPPAGCSTEDLRLYVLQVVKQQDAHARDTTDLEMRIAVQLNGITRDIGELGKESQAVKRDVGVSEAIKHLVTESALDVRTAAIYEDIKVLTLKTQSFAEHLEGYLQRTDIMEKTFQGHIATAFAKVESEFAEIKSVVQGVHNAGADAGDAASTATFTIQQHSLHQRTARVEAEHVGVKSELAETQQGSAMLSAQVQAVVAKMDASVAAAIQ